MTRRTGMWSHAARALVAIASAGVFIAASAAPCLAQPAEEDFKDDFSALGWTQAFDALHDALQRKYAFGDWKRIAWQDLVATWRPQIVAAEAQRDETAYLLALRRYSQAFPDGHVSLVSSPDNEIANATRRAQVGGGYGLTVVKLDDGEVVADYVAAEGPAGRAGVRPGATIERWNDRRPSRALQAVDLLWASNSATREVRELEQLRFLVRAPIGATARLAFRNRGDARVRQAALRAIDDDYATLERTRLSNTVEAVIDAPIAFTMLPGRIGHLRIKVLLDRDGRTFLDQLDRTMNVLLAANVTGLVVDLRGNPGGQDEWAALIGGYFHARSRLYEQVAAYDIRRRELVRIPELTLSVEPRPVVFDRPVVALIDAGTGSSAEGVAMLVKQLPHGVVVGRYSTKGSFGLAGGEIRLPGNYVFKYPLGQSLDARGRIQIDSDARGRGGIAPDVPLAFTARHLAARQNGQDVELEAAACVVRWQSAIWR